MFQRLQIQLSFPYFKDGPRLIKHKNFISFTGRFLQGSFDWFLGALSETVDKEKNNFRKN